MFVFIFRPSSRRRTGSERSEEGDGRRERRSSGSSKGKKGVKINNKVEILWQSQVIVCTEHGGLWIYIYFISLLVCFLAGLFWRKSRGTVITRSSLPSLCKNFNVADYLKST